MSSVDERIVKMTFDNDEFEQGIKESSDSLTKFKQSLSKDTSATTLDNVSNTLSKMNFNSVLSGIESMTSRFSVFGISAATVIQDVTRKIESMADALVSAVTTEPVSAGWDEYELKMNSVQTIMSSTGEDIDTVNQYLEELNQYADDTIYSFSDMTESIGKFTNSGVSLEDAVTAIKGISNEAAVSGANANEASRAMYNFAQALSTGYVALIDWKSIENANMATKEFKEQLLETAVACGTVKETSDGMYKVLTKNASGSTLSDAIDATDGFRDSLSYQWLTTEVLIETLKDYGDATTEIGAKASAAATEVKTFSMLIDTLKEAMGSGWTETWETVFGNLEEAKEGWTAVSEALGAFIDKSADSRNTKLAGAMDSSWDQLLRKFTDVGISADDFNETMQELAINTGKVTEEMIEDAGGLENTLSKGWLSADLLNDAIAKLGGVTTSSASEAKYSLEECQDVVEDIIAGVYGNGADRVSALEELGYDAEELQKIVDKVWNGSTLDWDKYTEETATNLSECQQIVENIVKGTYGNGAARTSALEELGYDAEQLQTIVNAVWDGSTLNWDNYTEEALIAAGATEEEAEALMKLKTNMGLTDDELQQFVDDLNGGKASGRELLWDSILNTIEGLSRILGTVGSAWKNVFGTTTSEQIYNVIAAIEGFTEKLLINQETANKLQRTFRGLFSILSIIKTTVSAVISRVFKLFSNTLGGLDIDVLGFTGDLGLAIDRFRQWYESNDIANKAIDAMVPLLKKAGNGLKSMVSKAAEIPKVAQVIKVLKNVFESLKDEIQNGFPTIQKWFGNFTEWLGTLDDLTLEDVKQTFKDLFTTIKDGKLTFDFPSLDKIKEKFPKAAEAIQDFINKIKNFDTPTLDKISEKIKSLIEAFQNGDKGFKFPTLTELSELFPSAVNAITTAIEKLQKAFGFLSGISISDGVQAFLNSISEIVNMSHVSSAELGDGSEVSENIDNTVTVIDAVKDALSKLNKSIGDADFNINFGAIAAAIVGIGYLVMLFKLLGTISNFGKAALSVGGFFDSLSGIMQRVTNTASAVTQTENSISNSTASSKSGTSKIVTLCLSLAVLAGVLIALGKQDVNDLKKAGITLAALAALLLILQGVSGLMSKKGLSGSFKGMGVTILALAAALWIIVDALQGLSSVTVSSNASNAILAIIGALTLAVVALQVTSPVLSRGEKTLQKTAITILAIAVALKLLVSALNDLTQTSYTIDDLAALGILLAELAAAMILISSASKGSSIGSSVSILATVISLKAFISILDDIAAMPLKTIVAAIPKLAIILTELAAVMLLARLAGNKSGGTSILAMTVSVIVIAKAMQMLSEINSSDMDQAMVAMMEIVGLLIVFVTLANATSKSVSAGGKIKSGAGTLLAAAVAIGVMAAAMLVLAQIDKNKLANASAAILALGASFAMIEAFSGFAKGKMSSIIALAAVITVLAGAVAALALFVDPSALKNATDCLSELLITLSVLEAVTGLMSKGTSSVVTLAGLALVVAGLALVFQMLGSMENPSNLLTVADAMTEVILALSVMMVAMIAIPSNPASAVSKCVGLVALLGTLVAVAGVVATLNNFVPDFMSLVGSGFEVIGEWIGELIGGIVNGVGDATEGTGAIESMSSMLTSLTDSVSSLSSVDSSILDNASTLASAILKLTGAELLDAIAGFISGDSSMETFGAELEAFGNSMVAFAAATSGLSSDSLSGAIDAASALVDLENSIPSSDGLYQKLVGEQSWETLGGGLAEFGSALVSFSDSVSGESFDADAISSSATAASALVEVLNAIPSEGGWLDGALGTEDWSTLGDGLEDFGEALKGYSEQVSGEAFDTAAIEASATAAGSLVTLLDAIPSSGGYLQKFSGEKDWETLSGGLVSFGLALLLYSATVSGQNIDTEAIAASAAAGESLATLLDAVPSADGYLQKFTGEKSWETLGGGLAEFGEALGNFSTYVADLNTDDIDTAITASKKLAEFQDSLGSDGGWWTFFTGEDTTFTDFGENLEALGTAFKSFAASISGTTWSDTTSMTEALEDIVNIVALSKDAGDGSKLKKIVGNLEEIGNAEVSGYVSALSESGAELQAAGETAVSEIVTGMTNASAELSDSISAGAATLVESFAIAISEEITTNQATFNDTFSVAMTTMAEVGSVTLALSVDDFESAGTVLIDAVADGIGDGSEDVSTAATSVLSSSVSKIRNRYQSFYNSGKYLMEGLAQGITNNQYKAINAATTTATNTLKALNEALDEHSPSKATRQSGQYFDEGFALGIADLAGRVADESSSVGSVALSALAGVSDKISSYLSEEQSFTPSITPVLDLSNVSSGAQQISGMLGRSYGLNIDTAKINTLSAAMQNRQNGSTNDDVVSAIKKLNNTMSTDRQNIYNVNGVTYDDGSNVSSAVQQLVRAASIARRA
ncbi:MAG: tape measure protein [Clostridiales bacterium]|nr:tape measure protein [Clostridiales bacterium]